MMNVRASSIIIAWALGYLLGVLSYVQGAVGWTHGGSVARQPVVSCDITTGNCTGVGAGSALFTAATCNGVADDAAAFISFHNFIVNTWQPAHGTGPVGLTWGAGKDCVITGPTISCHAIAQNSCPFIDIKDLIVSAYGASFHPNEPFTLGGSGLTYQANSSARIATANAGDTCVTATTVSQAGFFTAGLYVLISGFDMQAYFGYSGYGQPANQYYYEYVKVLSKDAGTGQVCFTTPITKTYLSTWPAYDLGIGVGHANDQGGPATLYVMDASWDSTVELRGMTLERAGNQTGARSKDVILRDVTLTGPNCFIPSNNLTVTWHNVTGNSCDIETDKLIGTWTINGGSVYQITNQSASLDLVMNGTTIINKLNGTPRTFTGTNITIPQTCLPSGACLTVGALGFGRTNSFSCTGCSIGSFAINAATADGGAAGSGAGVDNTWSMSGGLITIPQGSYVISSANNGSGLIRVTLATTAGLISGKWVEFNAVCRTGVTNNGSCVSGGPDTSVNGLRQITVINGTDVDIVGSTFISAAVQNGTTGRILVQQPRWAVPGTNFCFTSTQDCEELYQVTAVTQDNVANVTKVQTTAPGGFPPLFLGGASLRIKVHPASQFTCSGCTGVAGAGLNYPAGLPLMSYATCSFTGAVGALSGCQPRVWGNLTSLSLNITNAYVGAGSLWMQLSQGNNWPVRISNNTTPNYGPNVDAKVVGNRTITLSTVTNPQTNDFGLAAPDAVTSWFMGVSNSRAAWSSDVSASCPGVNCPAATITIQTNPGVVPSSYLLKRDLDPAANDNTPMWLDAAA